MQSLYFYLFFMSQVCLLRYAPDGRITTEDFNMLKVEVMTGFTASSLSKKGAYQKNEYRRTSWTH